MTFTETDVASLTTKLVELDLTEPEREALRTIVARAVAADVGAEKSDGDDTSEVAGFGYEAITLERGAVDFRPVLAGLGSPANGVWKAPANRPDAFLPTGETAM